MVAHAPALTWAAGARVVGGLVALRGWRPSDAVADAPTVCPSVLPDQRFLTEAKVGTDDRAWPSWRTFTCPTRQEATKALNSLNRTPAGCAADGPGEEDPYVVKTRSRRVAGLPGRMLSIRPALVLGVSTTTRSATATRARGAEAPTSTRSPVEAPR